MQEARFCLLLTREDTVRILACSSQLASLGNLAKEMPDWQAEFHEEEDGVCIEFSRMPRKKS